METKTHFADSSEVRKLVYNIIKENKISIRMLCNETGLDFDATKKWIIVGNSIKSKYRVYERYSEVNALKLLKRLGIRIDFKLTYNTPEEDFYATIKHKGFTGKDVNYYNKNYEDFMAAYHS